MTVTAYVSVLPVAGSELPANSDGDAAVRAAPLDEAVENTLDVVGLNVGQSWFRTDSEVILPLTVDEHSMLCNFVRPDTVPVIQVDVSIFTWCDGLRIDGWTE